MLYVSQENAGRSQKISGEMASMRGRLGWFGLLGHSFETFEHSTQRPENARRGKWKCQKCFDLFKNFPD